MAGTRKVFPTKFVWDHGGSEVCLAINGGPPVKLQKEEDGTFEVTHNCLQALNSVIFADNHKPGPRQIRILLLC